MVRPKKGTRASDIANEKWRATMLAKYGSAEELHKSMQRMGQKGGSAFRETPRWFALHPNLAKTAGAKGGENSTRAGIKNGQGKRWKKLEDKIKEELRNV